jgi:hypothetical protein
MSDEGRLLPWTDANGNPCYLTATDGNGPVARKADRIEAAQLELAGQLLDAAQEALRDDSLKATEFQELGNCLCAALGDALRVAASRGNRLDAQLCDETSELSGAGTGVDAPAPHPVNAFM